MLGVASAHAEAGTPWWGASYNTRPSNLQLGSAVSQVEQFTIGEESIVELSVGGVSVGDVVTGAFTAFLPEANAANVQEDLEIAYGTGNVEVTGGPGDVSPLIVKSIGADADRPVAALKAMALAGSANVEVLQQGKTDGQIVVTAENLGDSDANGKRVPVQISDTLPNGLKAVVAEGLAGQNSGSAEGSLAGEAGPVHCPNDPGAERTVTCTFDGVLHPYETIEVRISVVIEANASSGEENEITVSGGRAATAKTIRQQIQLGGHESFGVQEATLTPEEAGGEIDTQAGSHPFQLTSVIDFNQSAGGKSEPVEMPKDVSVLAPPGLVGNPSPFTRCTDQQFDTVLHGVRETNLCPTSSAVGVATVTFDEPALSGITTVTSPVFNMVPNAGEPARFGFYVSVVRVMLNTSVRTGGDYGITVSSHNITEVAGLLSVKVTLWGVPGDSRHDEQRGWACLAQTEACDSEDQEAESTPPPFLSLPTSCTGPLHASVETDSWDEPKRSLSFGMSEAMPALDGCNRLPFAPEIQTAPDVSDASTSSGLTVNVRVPQTAALNPEGLAESTLRNTTVVLPAGVAINPGGADGLEACSEAGIGFLGKETGEPGMDLFTSGLPVSFCPDASKIATVEIETPLLPNALKGAVYLASQDANPFGSLVAMYLVAEDPVSGTLVKLPGEVSLDPGTGQITATFLNTPQLPFEELRLHFFGGGRAPLSTPSSCGSYTTDASFAPWSGDTSVPSTSTFQATSGPNGASCQSLGGFAPSLTAGTTNIQAGAFSPLTLTMSREDGQQNLQAIQLKTPPGLLGMLSTVALCGEAQADAGTCGPESEIGETTVSVGVGGTPYTVTGGKVFITGPYEGAPYGLSIVNPAKAGPFDLGNVIVRARIEVDRHTSALTVTSDDSGPYKIPTILDGIPLEIQHVNVTIGRPGFIFNPTSCEKMAIGGSLSSAEGATSTLSVPFQVSNCAALPFKPGFTASTKAKHTRKDGAYLQVKVTSGSGQADIAKAKVELPVKLPSRLSTLQQACTEAQFDENPAGCPAASQVGSVVVHTPVLPVPLTGPAYFVSRGAQWPELIMVLQGYGVTVDLNGETHISKGGVTSTTLGSVPDVPFTSFTLTLPEGPHSALAGNGNLCKEQLAMPTSFTGQNGVQIEKQVKVKVAGCAATRKKGGGQKGGGKHEQSHKRREKKHGNEKGHGVKQKHRG
jgi:hypothetical protein